jgi:hypothetical protein
MNEQRHRLIQQNEAGGFGDIRQADEAFELLGMRISARIGPPIALALQAAARARSRDWG